MSNRRRYPQYPTADHDQQQNQVPQFNQDNQIPMVEQQAQDNQQQLQQNQQQQNILQQQFQPQVTREAAGFQQSQPQQQFDGAQQFQQQVQQPSGFQPSQAPQPNFVQVEEQQTQQQFQNFDYTDQKQAVTSNIIQFTHGVFPSTTQDIQRFKLPVGLLIQPHSPEVLPIVNFNEELRVNPQRCNNCKSFVNCYSQFTPAGRLICNVCGMESTLDFEYERILKDPNSKNQRVELQYEAFQVRAPDIYRIRRGETFETYTLVIDVGLQSIESGFVKQISDQLYPILENLHNAENIRSMVSIILYSTQVHFLVFRNRNSFEIYTIPDIDGPYIPAPRDIIVSMQSRGKPILEAVKNLEAIARSLPQLSPQTQTAKFNNSKDSCFYTALELGYKCMTSVGGKLLYFLSSLPSCGSGALHKEENKRRDAGKKQDGDIKRALTADQPCYTDLGVKCSMSQVSIDGIIATPLEYVDVATLIEMSRLSSGTLHYLPEYEPERDTGLFTKRDGGLHKNEDDSKRGAEVLLREGPQWQSKFDEPRALRPGVDDWRGNQLHGGLQVAPVLVLLALVPVHGQVQRALDPLSDEARQSGHSDQLLPQHPGCSAEHPAAEETLHHDAPELRHPDGGGFVLRRRRHCGLDLGADEQRGLVRLDQKLGRRLHRLDGEIVRIANKHRVPGAAAAGHIAADALLLRVLEDAVAEACQLARVHGRARGVHARGGGGQRGEMRGDALPAGVRHCRKQDPPVPGRAELRLNLRSERPVRGVRVFRDADRGELNRRNCRGSGAELAVGADAERERAAFRRYQRAGGEDPSDRRRQALGDRAVGAVAPDRAGAVVLDREQGRRRQLRRLHQAGKRESAQEGVIFDKRCRMFVLLFSLSFCINSKIRLTISNYIELTR